MKNKSLPILIVIALTLALAPALCAEVIDNPAKPAASNAGRVAKLTEVMRITDESGDFYLKRPFRLKVANDGSIFVADDGQLLKFTPDGKFVANLQKKGEGPGEFTYLAGMKVFDKHLTVVSAMPIKIIKFDLSGKLIKEIVIGNKRGMRRIMGIFPGKYYFLNTKIDFGKTKSGVKDFNQVLNRYSFDQKTTDLKTNFPLRRMVKRAETKDGGIMLQMYNIDNLCFALENENSFFISHDSAYTIKHVNLETGKVLRTFRRKYDRVPFVVNPERKHVKMDFFSDISRMAFNNGKLWVFTSTLGKEKGVLVDVFSLEGKYLDNFYLPLPGLSRPNDMQDRPLLLDGKILYIVEKDDEDTPSIVKYRLNLD